MGCDKARLGGGNVRTKADDILGNQLGDDGFILRPALDEEGVRREEFAIRHIDGDGAEILAFRRNEMNGWGAVNAVFGFLDRDGVGVAVEAEGDGCGGHRV